VTAASPRPFRLYPIIDTAVCRARGRDPRAVAEACVRGGARILQLRSKEESSAETLALADAFVSLALPHDALIIVNDRPDIARMAGAGGVHVGQDDLPVSEARRILGPRAIVGLSTHTREQIDAALESDADYVAVGPVFGTATKDTGYSAVGLELLSYAAHRGKPVIAIGGVTLERATQAWAAGAAGVAVISDLLQEDTEARVRAYLNV
jgi:thiamine-phosphate pyrophosphorylase